MRRRGEPETSEWYSKIEFPAGDEMAVPYTATTSTNAGPAPKQRHGRPNHDDFGEQDEVD